MLENIAQFVAQYWRIPVEIGILAAVLYYIYIYLRGTHGARILIGLALLFLTLTFLSQLFNLAVIGWILRSLSVFLAIALVVIFQPELRRALTDLGSHPFFTSAFEKRETIEELTDTAFEISSKGFGALIAVEREIALKPFIETGVMLDAAYSKELALTIFHPKTVLHDGGLDRAQRSDGCSCLHLSTHAAGGSRSKSRTAPPSRLGIIRRIRRRSHCRFRGDRPSFDLPQWHP